MKVNGNNLKAGMIVSHKGGMWKVISTQSVKPGKGGAFAQVELKNLKDSSKLNERFRSSEVVERLYVETKLFSILTMMEPHTILWILIHMNKLA